MARPKKQDSTAERYTAHLSVWLTPSDRAKLDGRATQYGRRLSDYARIVLLSDVKAPVVAGPDPAAIRALAVQLARIGNNLNQLAAMANERRAMPLERDLRGVLSEIKATLAKVAA